MFQKGFEKSDDRFSRIFQGFTYKSDHLGKFQRENMCGKFSRKKIEKLRIKNRLAEKTAKTQHNSPKQNPCKMSLPVEIRNFPIK